MNEREGKNAATLGLVALLAIPLFLIFSSEPNDAPLVEEVMEGPDTVISSALEGNAELSAPVGRRRRAPTLSSSERALQTDMGPQDLRAYEVTFFYPVSKLLDGTISAEGLFRNRSLNPDDVALSAAIQESIRELIQIRVPPLAEFKTAAKELAVKDLENLVVAGKAMSITYLEQTRQAQMEFERKLKIELQALSKAGIDPKALMRNDLKRRELTPKEMFGFEPYALQTNADGTIFAAEMKDLPGALDMHHALAYAILNTSNQLGNLFLTAEALSPVQFTKFMTQTKSILSGYFPDIDLK